MVPSEQLVFLSYASEDREFVLPIADLLSKNGLDVWLDVNKIKAGQDWNFEIRKGLEQASIIVVFISNKSNNKRGFVQREINIALNKYEEKLVDDIYLIPVLIGNNVSLPEKIKNLQFIRFEDDAFSEKLLDSISHQLKRIGLAVETVQNEAEVHWQFYKHTESRDGIPGIEADFRLPRLSSDKYEQIWQVSDIIKGSLLEMLCDLRSQTLTPDPQFFNFGQGKYSRTHTLDVIPQTPKICGRILTVLYSIHSNYAGAAHPNVGYRSYCFLVDPLCQIERIDSIFENKDAALSVIQKELRKQLLLPKVADEEEYNLEPDWVIEGTESWDCFQVFSFEEDRIEFLFAPYEVAPYVCGTQFASVKYDLLVPYIKKLYKSALDIEYMLPPEDKSQL